MCSTKVMKVVGEGIEVQVDLQEDGRAENGTGYKHSC